VTRKNSTREGEADFAEIEIKNLGPLHHAKFVLHPLTLFVGQNGVGKTLVATLIYAFQKSIWSATREVRGNLVRAYQATNKQLRDLGADARPTQTDLVEILRAHLNEQDFAERLRSAFNAEVIRAIAPPKEFIRHGCRGAALNYAQASGLKFTAEFGPEGISSNWSLPEISEESIPPLVANFGIFTEARINIDRCLRHIFGVAYDQPVMIPAGRAGITDTFQFLAEQVLLERHGMSRHGISGVTRDFLALLVGSGGGLQRGLFDSDPDDRDQVSNLFDQLLKGQLRPSPDPGELVTFEVEGTRISRNVQSSMVKELGPMVVLLQQSESLGSSLIVDEPECHLHPRAQIDLAKVFVALVAQDARFLLSTHSPFLAQSLSSEWIRQSKEGRLNNKDFSVVAFSNENGKVSARNLPFIDPFGFEFDEFVDAADAVQETFTKLFDDQEELEPL
jgi:predicted ATPase